MPNAIDNTVTTSGTVPSSPSIRATAAVPPDGGAERRARLQARVRD